MKTNDERKLMTAAIRRGSVGATALAFVLCVTSVQAAAVPCCLSGTREGTVGSGTCVSALSPRACELRGGWTATSCRQCYILAPMIQQPDAADGDGDSVSDVADETAGSDLADASGAAQPGSAWTLLVATMFLVGL